MLDLPRTSSWLWRTGVIAATMLGLAPPAIVHAQAPSSASTAQTSANAPAATAVTGAVGWIEGILRREMAAKGFVWGSAAHIRTFKEEGVVEIWLEKAGRFERFKTFEVCKWSGKLGPKLREGDEQSPEGIYTITRRSLLARTKNHRAIALNFPNIYDARQGRTGSYLQIHGGCGSVGCYAMTDRGIEEIYRLLRAALDGGQQRIAAHIFPFRMTRVRLAREKAHPAYREWRQLQPIHAALAMTNTVPQVRVCGRRYVLDDHGARPPERCVPVWQSVPKRGIGGKAAEVAKVAHASKAATSGVARSTKPARKAPPARRITVRCNLSLPSCKRWLALQRRKLRRRGVATSGVRRAGASYVRRAGFTPRRETVSSRSPRARARAERRRRLRR
ncbi:MAG: hypothetical protein AAFQ42_10955 [Pseudomonadota bacterium]